MCFLRGYLGEQRLRERVFLMQSQQSLPTNSGTCSLLPPALLQLPEALSCYPKAFLNVGLPGSLWTPQSWCPVLLCLPWPQHTITAHWMPAEWAELLKVLLKFDLINPQPLSENLVLPLSLELYTGQVKIHASCNSVRINSSSVWTRNKLEKQIQGLHLLMQGMQVIPGRKAKIPHASAKK